MTRALTLLLVICALLSLIVACEKKDEWDETDVIIPLRIGNQWTYVDSTLDVNRVDSSQTTVSIPGKLNIGGENVYHWRWHNQEASLIWLHSNRKDGLYQRGGMAINDTLIIDELYLKYPANNDASWDLLRLSYSGSEVGFSTFPVTMNCTSNSVTFDTPSGTLSGCYVYSFDYSYRSDEQREFCSVWGVPFPEDSRTTYTYELYYKPRIGYVGLLAYRDGVRNYSKRLLEYSIYTLD